MKIAFAVGVVIAAQSGFVARAAAAAPWDVPTTVAAAQCATPAARTGDVSNAETRYIERNLLPALTGKATRPTTLKARMTALQMAGVSVAVFADGKIAWARGWGVRDAATCQPVTADTVFQAASISKTFAALLAMQQVERGKLALDTDINASLTRWKLPHSDAFAPGFVTLRQLLNHTAGTSVSGFAGYAPDLPRPTIVQTLAGLAPANNEPVRLIATPGAGFNYSGGGYTIIQAALEDVTHQSFADLAQQNILTPVGMMRSRFAQPIAADMLANAAHGHDEGNPFAASYYVYPELAAAGLWTTPTDLARLLIDVQAAAAGAAGRVVAPETAWQMLKPGANDWGLGYATWCAGHDKRFGHFGGNMGFVSEMWSFADRGEGIVVLTNGENGLRLADEIVRAVANRRGWAEFASKPLTTAIAATPIFLRGTMNDWATETPFTRTAAGAYRAEIELKPGDFEFKIASADWTGFVLGREPAMPLVAGVKQSALSSSGGNIALKIAAAGRYRFFVQVDDAGTALLSVQPAIIP